jgi:sulfur-oxidizing protein SoxA
MQKLLGTLVAVALLCSGINVHAADSLSVGRQMLNEDNPGELWIDTGKALFYQKRGPKNASLEQCDFGMGPGKLEGAAARMPRYFADTDRVEDMESRLLTCMSKLQGFDRNEVAKKAISSPRSKGSDIEALALYVTSRSNGMKVNVTLSHQKEYDAYKAGEYIFYRRSGQTDFGCVQCHGRNCIAGFTIACFCHLVRSSSLNPSPRSSPLLEFSSFTRVSSCLGQSRWHPLSTTQ